VNQQLSGGGYDGDPEWPRSGFLEIDIWQSRGTFLKYPNHRTV
jgi:hypothetical protein